jgi:dimethylargininase
MSEAGRRIIAITHAPSPRLQRGQRTHVQAAEVDFDLACTQHAAYCDALRRCGAEVVTLQANLDLPDSAFVEDAAVVLDEAAIVTSMGTQARRAELAAVEQALAPHRPLRRIELPATLEGGDVLRVDRTLLVGISSRTSVVGIAALEAIAGPFGYRIRPVQVRGCLHLKTACTAIDAETLLINPDWIDAAAIGDYRQIAVPPEERWAANVLPVNGQLLLASAHRRTRNLLERLGHRVLPVDISEFAKAEGGVTCLSILLPDVRWT